MKLISSLQARDRGEEMQEVEMKVNLGKSREWNRIGKIVEEMRKLNQFNLMGLFSLLL